MSLVNAKEYLKNIGLEDRIIELKEKTGTVKEAALALHCEEGDIAKTLSFLLDDNKAILILTAGDKKIDNQKYKEEFNTKAKMIPFELVNNYIGHEVGGVCPFGIKDGVDVYLDVSLKEHEIIYPACGSANSAVKLTIEDLEKSSNYLKWIDVCK